MFASSFNATGRSPSGIGQHSIVGRGSVMAAVIEGGEIDPRWFTPTCGIRP
ncbi:MAG TPA: hypothetical protein VF070_07045 [Streptosporangiaceae bacterium]